MEDEQFDVEKCMAEIKVAAPELVDFLIWVVEMEAQGEVEADEVHSALELVYSYSRNKNEAEEERMLDGRS